MSEIDADMIRMDYIAAGMEIQYRDKITQLQAQNKALKEKLAEAEEENKKLLTIYLDYQDDAVEANKKLRQAENELREARILIDDLKGYALAKVQFPHKDCPELIGTIDRAIQHRSKWQQGGK